MNPSAKLTELKTITSSVFPNLEWEVTEDRTFIERAQEWFYPNKFTITAKTRLLILEIYYDNNPYGKDSCYIYNMDLSNKWATKWKHIQNAEINVEFYKEKAQYNLYTFWIYLNDEEGTAVYKNSSNNFIELLEESKQYIIKLITEELNKVS